MRPGACEQHGQGSRNRLLPCVPVGQHCAAVPLPGEQLLFHAYNVFAQGALPVWVSLFTSGLLGFYHVWARFCLENTDPRTRGRGIQLLSQVLLECHSLLQEKEGKVCYEFWNGCKQVGGQACALKESSLCLAKELI